MLRRATLALLALCAFYSTISEAAVYDNRFFPFYSYIFPRTKRKQSWFNMSSYFITGDEAEGQAGKVGIPELCGKFDQKKLGEELENVGLPNPLRPDFQLLPIIPWDLCGKITGQGLGFEWEQAITCRLSMGLSFWYLHTSSNVEFVLDPVLARDLGFIDGKEGDLFELDRELREMLREIGLEGGQWSKSGVTDIDFYLRYGDIWDYVWKFRSVAAGIKVGVLGPSGTERTICNPASIPFSGNKHAGFYGEADFQLELKEDIYFGGLLRVTGRKSDCEAVRFATDCETPLFGVIQATSTVDPGVGVAGSLYATIEGIRDGLGLQARYTIAYHGKDCFSNIQIAEDLAIEQVPQESINQLVDCSTFISEYFSLNLFYDFGTKEEDCLVDTKLFFAWDIPIEAFAAKNFVRTNRVALGFQLNY